MNTQSVKMIGVSVACLLATCATSVDAQDRPTAPQADLSKAVRNAQMVEPFKVFDNLYYVGMDWVSAWLISTDDGLILIDALYGEFADAMIENIRKLGLDPADIKYCFATHGHFDHAAGVKQVKDAAPGMRIGMIDADWEMYLNKQGGGRYDLVAKDIVVKDGDTITLGGQTLTFYNTPGHTTGVLSVAFAVFDNGTPHKAFTVGGAGLNFAGVDRCQMFIASMERIKALPGIEVNAANHPTMAQAFERNEKLKARQPGDPHPFVDSAAFYAWIDQLVYDGNRKLRTEQERAK